jgi:hypothetical protein
MSQRSHNNQLKLKATAAITAMREKWTTKESLKQHDTEQQQLKEDKLRRHLRKVIDSRRIELGVKSGTGRDELQIVDANDLQVVPYSPKAKFVS